MSAEPRTHCSVCHSPLEFGESWWRCPRSVTHPCGGRSSEVGMGEIFSEGGEPWAKLPERERHSRWTPHGWRMEIRRTASHD